MILIGGGDRGSSYLKYLDVKPEQFELVGLAEPVKEKRDYLMTKYNVTEDMCFESYDDLLQWIIGESCEKVQSFGTLSYFCEKNAPQDASERCLDGCPHKDTYFCYAPDIYKIKTAEVQHFRAIVAKKFNPTDEEVDACSDVIMMLLTGKWLICNLAMISMPH